MQIDLTGSSFQSANRSPHPDSWPSRVMPSTRDVLNTRPIGLAHSKTLLPGLGMLQLSY